MVGWPGSVHDARVFANSSVYHKANQKEILNTNRVRIRGIDIYPFIVADSAYPLKSWLMKPFPYNSTMSSGKEEIQLYSIKSPNCHGKCLWSFKGSMETTNQAK